MSAPKPPRCLSCARPMQLLRRTSRFGGLPDLYYFYCVTCDEWHVEEGDAVADRRPIAGRTRHLTKDHYSGHFSITRIRRIV